MMVISRTEADEDRLLRGLLLAAVYFRRTLPVEMYLGVEEWVGGKWWTAVVRFGQRFGQIVNKRVGQVIKFEEIERVFQAATIDG